MNMKPSSLKPGVRLHFHPVFGAMHTAEGVIKTCRTYKGIRYMDVSTDTLNGAASTPGTIFTIIADDIICILPAAAVVDREQLGSLSCEDGNEI